MTSPGSANAGPIVLYDGVCGLCNRAVRFILRHDRRQVFRFATLQGEYAAEVLRRHGRDPARLDTVCVVEHPGTDRERLHVKGRAALWIARRLGLPWSLAGIFGIVPRPILDAAYNVVARHRYRIFGKADACPLPDPAVRSRFLDL